jgi:hypothetical protein
MGATLPILAVLSRRHTYIVLQFDYVCISKEMTMKRPNVKRELPCRLTARELTERSEALAHSVTELTALGQKKKAIADELKEEEGEWKSIQRKLSHQIVSGEEDRIVVCEWTPSIAEKCWRLHRVDTGEVIGVEAMTEKELQAELFPIGG